MSVRDYITGKIRFPGGPQSSCGEDDVQMVDNVDLIFGDSEELKFGDDADVKFAWDGSNLNILPLTDLTGAILIGNGTLSMDLKVFGTVAANYFEYDASEDRLNLVITTRTITGEDHALDVSYAGVCAAGGSDAMVGVNVAVTPTGVGAGWVSAFFGKVTEVAAAGGPVSGYFCGAEFEVNITGSQPSAYAVLVLNSNADNSTYGQTEAYVFLREYGSKAVRSLFNFMDHARASASNAVIVSQTTDKPYDTMIRCTIGSAGTTPLWLLASSVGPATAALESGSVVHILNQAPQAFKYECSLTAQQGAWVHGMKVEVTRAADVQPATGGWFGAQFVLNAGSSGYAALNKGTYVLQAVFKGSDTNPNGTDIHVGRFELQSAGKVSDIVHILANTGCTIVGHMLYLAAHINTSGILINVQSSATIAKGLSFLAGAGATMTSLLYAYGAGTFTNFLEVAASGDGGLTLGGDGMTKSPNSDTEDGWLTVLVGSTSYQIPMYAA